MHREILSLIDQKMVKTSFKGLKMLRPESGWWTWLFTIETKNAPTGPKIQAFWSLGAASSFKG